jgi:LmbE family N-acetylglucosaminyl deacetylase
VIRFEFGPPRSGPLTVLCLGAHSDDIEIGCGGTLLRLLSENPEAIVHWWVFSAAGEREAEARCGATLFAGPRLGRAEIRNFRDGFMPYAGADIKEVFESDLEPLAPDVIFTHMRDDAHQDHRLVSELTWNTFRDHLILEYEIPKFDGDLGRPSVFVPLDEAVCKAKVDFITRAFVSQRSRSWFSGETFLALLRLRGLECNAPGGYAEAFYCRKVVL